VRTHNHDSELRLASVDLPDPVATATDIGVEVSTHQANRDVPDFGNVNIQHRVSTLLLDDRGAVAFGTRHLIPHSRAPVMVVSSRPSCRLEEQLDADGDQDAAPALSTARDTPAKGAASVSVKPNSPT